MVKAADAFRTISEVAEWLDVPAHVLRFWESKFTQVKPVKRAGGRRYYRPSDMRLLGGIKTMLHDQGMTIKAVQKYLREHGVQEVATMSQPLEDLVDGDAPDTTARGIMRDVSASEFPEPAVVNFRRKSPREPIEDAEEADAEPAGGNSAEANSSRGAADDGADGTDAPTAAPQPPITRDEEEAASGPPEGPETEPQHEARPSLPPADTPPADTPPKAAETAQSGLCDPSSEGAAPLPPMPDLHPPATDAPEPDDAQTSEAGAAQDEVPATEITRTLPDLPDLRDLPDLPDDDPDDDMDAAPGILSALSRLPRPVPPEMAARFATLRDRLQDRASRLSDGQ